MSNRRVRHGNSVRAPREEAGIPDEPSPSPPAFDDDTHVGVVKGSRKAKKPRKPKKKRQKGDPPGFFGRLWSSLKLASGVAIVVTAAVALAWGLRHYALTTPRFAIQELQISGSKRFSEAELARQGGFELGDNLLALDSDQVEQRLLTNPWIKQVKVTRKLPGVLAVELEERDAAALAVVGGQLYLVTRDGEPFKRLESKDPSDLPLITGISAENIARDRPREIERIATAMQVIRAYDRIPMSKVHPAQEAHLEKGGAVTLIIGKKGIALHLGKGPWRRKLLMGWRVMGRLSRKGQLPGIVFLDNEAHPERVVVRMR